MASKVLDFEGDVAIVTGAGCRSSNEVGNGRAVAILLARRGAKVALVDVNIKWAEETKQFIVSEGGLAHAIEADVSDEQSCQRIVNETVKVFGGLNLLVNNVGVTGALGGQLGIIEFVNRKVIRTPAKAQANI